MIQQRESEQGYRAPRYLVSMGDMMSIILTFFILLCSYATERNAGFVSDGIGSFKNGINALGLPGILPGDRYPIDLGYNRVRYRPPEAINSRLLDEADGRITDANRDALRAVVKSALVDDDVTRLPIELIFDRGKASLTEQHRMALDIVAPILRGKPVDLRIDGFAYEEGPGDSRPLAVGRARAIADHLTSEHGFDARRLGVVGYGSGGAGADKRAHRVVQDRLGRRIALIYLVPRSEGDGR